MTCCTSPVPLESTQFDVDGVLVTGRQQVRWIGQLVARNHKFAVHMDGKYKLHHGKMILISIGTHHFRWDSDRQELTHQYGAFFMVDEVQTGLGACGNVWCHEAWDLPTPPDFVPLYQRGSEGGSWRAKYERQAAAGKYH